MLDLDWIRNTLKEAIEDEDWDLVREVMIKIKYGAVMVSTGVI